MPFSSAAMGWSFAVQLNCGEASGETGAVKLATGKAALLQKLEV
jgi:hypothetical protein